MMYRELPPAAMERLVGVVRTHMASVSQERRDAFDLAVLGGMAWNLALHDDGALFVELQARTDEGGLEVVLRLDAADVGLHLVDEELIYLAESGSQ